MLQPSLEGSFQADNVGTLYLNGNLVVAQDGTAACEANNCPTSNYKISTPFLDSTPADFVNGTNTLKFSVTDYGVATALDFTATVTYIATADLSIAKTASPSTIFANESDAQNTVTFDVSVTNAGPSTAKGVQITDALDSKLTGAEYCQVTGVTPCVSIGSTYSGSISVPDIAPGSTVEYLIRAHAVSTLGHAPQLTGPFTVGNQASVTSSTKRTNGTLNDKTSSETATTVDTVPGKPMVNQVTAGNGKLGVNWSPPNANGGQPVTSYTVYAAPCPAGGAGPCAVLTNVSSTPNAAPVVGSQFTTFSYFVSGLTNGTTYTLTVTATNAVGESDASVGVTGVPNASADTNKISDTTFQGTVDTGLAGGALTCSGDQSLVACKNIVGKYTVTDQKDAGALIALGAIPNADVPGFHAIACLEFDFGSRSVTSGGDCETVADKAVISTYPTSVATLSIPHLAYEQDDAAVTTYALGAPCLQLVTNANGTPTLTAANEPICANPNFPRVFNGTNMCPDSLGGWTKTHQCAYIYYKVERIDGYDLTPAGCSTASWPNCTWGTLTSPTGTRPVQCSPALDNNCGKEVIIGSSVSAGIKSGDASTTNPQYAVRPWCSGKFPNFKWLPCVFKVQWLNKVTNKGNNDIQWQDYEVADPGGSRTG
ncbi:MAG: DUF11 domain-containing protein [Actinomycetota bacterium]|nr:DUF11 domain-containing protein [Actinomycetota bacterium]